MDSKAISFISLALILLATTNCVIPESTGSAQNFDATLAQVKDSLKNITTNVGNMLGIPEIQNQDDVLKAFQNHTKELSSYVQNYITQLQKSSLENIDPFVRQLNNTITSLQTQEFQDKSKHLKETFSNSYNTIVEEVTKVATEVNKEAQPNGSFHEITTNTFNKLVDIAKNFQKNLNEVQANKKP